MSSTNPVNSPHSSSISPLTENSSTATTPEIPKQKANPGGRFFNEYSKKIPGPVHGHLQRMASTGKLPLKDVSDKRSHYMSSLYSAKRQFGSRDEATARSSRGSLVVPYDEHVVLPALINHGGNGRSEHSLSKKITPPLGSTRMVVQSVGEQVDGFSTYFMKNRVKLSSKTAESSFLSDYEDRQDDKTIGGLSSPQTTTSDIPGLSMLDNLMTKNDVITPEIFLNNSIQNSKTVLIAEIGKAGEAESTFPPLKNVNLGTHTTRTQQKQLAIRDLLFNEERQNRNNSERSGTDIIHYLTTSSNDGTSNNWKHIGIHERVQFETISNELRKLALFNQRPMIDAVRRNSPGFKPKSTDRSARRFSNDAESKRQLREMSLKIWQTGVREHFTDNSSDES
ncbi:Hypothetical protein PP7435_CHR3-0555 [Komagataella phaffii CBS 7435]|uniref:Uncharacterized protein n=1 Tax=Komagataella phaffii (strain ATCC 76273 / CBS 7435 / CECT 11047 / NRRL Y-11430 / Wegner 21-1) TaxID=981350 RepID=F2QVT5_KOMPC|nr:GQ67_03731T0 [Komagataella phaffii]AOA69242.1 GQ68_03703T0 [Komagataella phaffii GS115]CAH2449531.1 Hypothetical protein BQ9382_C3-2965 [Komagataella phaffii CBS 7435]CCA39513.1 Hypothetical protein PP7435_CHR3-0555 [Komagataella phaffii CBS 7435]